VETEDGAGVEIRRGEERIRVPENQLKDLLAALKQF
jgi:hypothetical protein